MLVNLFPAIFMLLLWPLVVSAQPPQAASSGGATLTRDAARAELQRRGLPFTEIAFIDTLIEGDTQAADLFLTAGMNPQAQNAEGNYALWYAAGRAHLDIVKRLIALGADVNSIGAKHRTPLGGAVLGSSVEVIKTLLDSGARIDDPGSAGGTTPLLTAVAVAGPDYEYPKPQGKAVVFYLLERGANPNIANENGITPLLEATGTGDKELVSALLASGAEVNHKANDAETPLLQIVRFGYDADHKQLKPDTLEIVQMLLAHQADTTAKDSDGKTALQLAREHRSEALITALLSPKIETHLFTRLGYYGFQFNKAQAWFGPAVYLIAVIIALMGLNAPLMPKREAVADGDGLPHLAPLKCEQCAAPVPIVTHNCACPNCSTSVNIPEDYVETLKLRQQAAENLQLAEKKWRRAWFYSMPLVTNLLLLLATLYLLAWLFGLFSPLTTLRPLPRFISILMSGLTLSAGLFFYSLYLISSRKLLPPLPRIGQAAAHAEITGCRQCGAALEFAANELVSCCVYCGSETYRVALARRSRKIAAEEEASTALSIYNAVVELDERRKGVFLGVAVIGTVLLLVSVAAIAITALLVLAAALILLYLYLKFVA